MTDQLTYPVGVDDDDGEEIKDFTPKRRRIRFRIDDDVFECAPALPADTLMNFIALADTMGDVQDPKAQMAGLRELFGAVLFQESATRFMARLADVEHPIGLEQINAIIPWLLGRYGLRPTPPSEDLSTGFASPDDGTSSTASAPEPALTSAPSP